MLKVGGLPVIDATAPAQTFDREGNLRQDSKPDTEGTKKRATNKKRRESHEKNKSETPKNSSHTSNHSQNTSIDSRDNLEIDDTPEVFKKYPLLTTDTPFNGMRTTTTAILPRKTLQSFQIPNRDKNPNSCTILETEADCVQSDRNGQLFNSSNNDQITEDVTRSPNYEKFMTQNEDPKHFARSFSRTKTEMPKDMVGFNPFFKSVRTLINQESFGDYGPISTAETPEKPIQFANIANNNMMKSNATNKLSAGRTMTVSDGGMPVILDQQAEEKIISQDGSMIMSKSPDIASSHLKKKEIKIPGERNETDDFFLLTRSHTQLLQPATILSNIGISPNNNYLIQKNKTEKKMNVVLPPVQQKLREREFEITSINRVNLFEGLPFVQYDQFLRQDPVMQNVIFRDLLKILVDKANGLKNIIAERGKLSRVQIFSTLSLSCVEFRNDTRKLGIRSSPLLPESLKKREASKRKTNTDVDGELWLLDANCELFLEMFDFLKDCVDGYFVMSRQKDRKPLDDLSCQDLLQFIARARYGLGDLAEEVRVQEKNAETKLKWQNETLALAKPKILTEYKDADALRREKNAKLFTLLQNKFNNLKSKQQTRESKIVLNQERVDEKKLLLLRDEKQIKKMRIIADHRKEIALEKLRNPFSISELKDVMRIADELNINLDRDLIELAANSKQQKNQTVPKAFKNEISQSLRATISCFMKKSANFAKKDEKHDLQKFTNHLPENAIEALDVALDKRRHIACVIDQEVVDVIVQKPMSKNKNLMKRTR